MEEQNIFSGLIYCKDCGGTMVLHRAHTMDAVKNNFMCSVYKKKGKENCSAHYIRESQLAEIILDDLRRVTHYARQHEFLFAKHITQKNSAEIRREIAQTERELENLKRRDGELTTLFKRLYEDNVLGKIPSEVFRKLSDDYLTEQKEIQTTISKKESSLERLKDSVSNVSAFIDKAKQYTEIKELTAGVFVLPGGTRTREGMSVKKNAKHFLANAHGSLWSLRDVRSVQRSWAVESLMLHHRLSENPLF